MDISTIIEDSFHRSDFLSGITEPQAADILNRGNHIRLQSGEFLLAHVGFQGRVVIEGKATYHITRGAQQMQINIKELD